MSKNDKEIKIKGKVINPLTNYTLSLSELKSAGVTNEQIEKLIAMRSTTLFYIDDNELEYTLTTLINESQDESKHYDVDVLRLKNQITNSDYVRNMWLSDETYDSISQDLVQEFKDNKNDLLEQFIDLLNVFNEALDEE
ncbi:MAG: hypothetical protein ACRCX2_22680 [Paraclostridium sp.]